MKAFQHKIVLASKSPRRSELLTKSGFLFDVKSMDVEEIYPATMNILEVPEFLANLKAEANISLINEDQILITADTVVIFDNRIFGKPKDNHDAVEMLKALSANMHTVVSGVSVRSLQKSVSFSDISTVHLAALTDQEINYYVDKYQPYDKAGSYAIQEWIGLCKIQKIQGSYSNIMGMPMQKLYPVLQSF